MKIKQLKIWWMLRRRGLEEPRKDKKREYHRDSRLSQAEIILIMIMSTVPITNV